MLNTPEAALHRGKCLLKICLDWLDARRDRALLGAPQQFPLLGRPIEALVSQSLGAFWGIDNAKLRLSLGH